MIDLQVTLHCRHSHHFTELLTSYYNYYIWWIHWNAAAHSQENLNSQAFAVYPKRMQFVNSWYSDFRTIPPIANFVILVTAGKEEKEEEDEETPSATIIYVKILFINCPNFRPFAAACFLYNLNLYLFHVTVCTLVTRKCCKCPKVWQTNY